MTKKFAQRLLLIALSSLALTGVAIGSQPEERTYSEKLGAYYDARPIAKDGDWKVVGIYRSANPAAKDEWKRYGFNCETREYKEVAGPQLQQISPVLKLFPGEPMYDVADKVCGWSDKGFIRKLFD